MRGMNRVTLVGNLGRDPAVKELADGIVVAKIALATTDVFRGKDGQVQANTQWHTVVFWRGLAKLASKYLRKGSLVLVEGKLMYRKYADKMGVVRYATEILASQLLMLDKPSVINSSTDQEEEDIWEGLPPF